MIKVVLLALLVVVAESLAKGLDVLHGKDPDNSSCPSSGQPAKSVRLDNKSSRKGPLFRLDIKEARDGYLPRETYRVYVQSQEVSKKFNDVLLSLHGDGSGCPMGTFHTASPRYFQPENCPHLVFKDTRAAEHTFTFSWTAPTCGCVTIRARIKSADRDEYYLDDDTVVDGYLTQRLCPKGINAILSSIPTNKREEMLCRVSQNISLTSIVHRPDIMSRRKLDYQSMSTLEKHALDTALQQRTRTVNMCCGLSGRDRHECLGDIRRRRLDHFCAYGESIIPFTIARRDYMMDRMKSCCWRLGEGRYHCFGNLPQGDSASPQALWNVKKMQHMDESDPLNDLEDFPKETLKQIPDNIILAQRSTKPKTSSVNDGKDSSQQQPIPAKMPTKAAIAPQATTRKVMTMKAIPVKSKLQDTTMDSKEIETTTGVTTFDTTKTTKKLLRKIKRYQMRLECCEQGKVFGGHLVGDPWQRCPEEAHVYSKTIRGGRRKCRAFYLRCCIEQYQSGQSSVSSDVHDADDDYDDDDDDVDDDGQHGDVTDQSLQTDASGKSSTPKPTKANVKPNTDDDNDDNGDDDDKVSKRKSKRRQSGNRKRRNKRRHSKSD